MSYSPKKMLITGGAGFIGSHFVRYCLAKYSALEIVNIDKLTYAGSMDNLVDLGDPSRHHFIQADICDKTRMAEIMRQFDIDSISPQKVMLIVRLPDRRLFYKRILSAHIHY